MKLNGGIPPNLHFLNANYPKPHNFLNLRLVPLCHRITLREHKKYALRVTKCSEETHLGTFKQNSKPKGANFDILHFSSL